MEYLSSTAGFEWKQLLLGKEEWSFLWETMLRSGIMFVVILISLRLLGKRGVKQLSVFELVVIIGLGSAAGDPMFYKDVGLLVCLVVFVMIIGPYKLINYIIATNKKIEEVVEGLPICLIKDGVFKIDNFKKEMLTEDEFFAELRQRGISQLGQVEEAIEESSGNISVFFFRDEAVRYGLPIMPGALNEFVVEIASSGMYACIFCGYPTHLEPANESVCPVCEKNKWIVANNRKRVV